MLEKKPKPTGQFLVARLNAKLQPIHRHELEDLLGEELLKAGYGEVSGGGTA